MTTHHLLDNSDESFTELYRMERDWQACTQALSLKELIDAYPGSEASAKRGLKNQILRLEGGLNTLDVTRERWHNELINKANFKEQPRLIGWLNDYIERQVDEYEREIKKCKFLLNSIDRKFVPAKTKNGVTDEQIQLAKQVPITSLIKVNRMGKAPCLWHTDKNPSLHYYKKNNSCYCFVCQKHADSIAVYMQMAGVGFVEAVRKLAV